MAYPSPTLSLPSSTSVPAGMSVALTGIRYDDSAAASNPGAMYLSIATNHGTLTASNNGTPVAGSGTSRIAISARYADIVRVLDTLVYHAGTSVGGDAISFDLWDQYGIETTGAIPVTVTTASSGGVTETWTGMVSGDWNDARNWSGNAVPRDGDSVVIPGGAPHDAALANAILTGETITLQQTSAGAPTVHFTNVTLASRLGGTGNGTIAVAGTLNVATTGEIIATTGSTIDVTAATAITIANQGHITADGGNLLFNPANPVNPDQVPPELLLNSGTVAIADGGSIWLNGTLSGGTISYGGTGTLTLEQPMALTDGAVVSGFVAGDMISLLSAPAGHGGQLAFSDGALQVVQGSSIVQSIPLAGSYGLGNFVNDYIAASAGDPTQIAYAADGAPSGLVAPDIAAPATSTIGQGSTLSLGDVSISKLGSAGYLRIDAGSGTLFMNGATNSGTSHLTLGPLSNDQINADLASLTYLPGAGATNDIVTIHATPGIAVETFRSIPVSITATSGRALIEPASAHVAAGTSQSTAGSYADSFAQHNPGLLFLGISDTSGTLSATDAAGNPVAGSGSHSIALSADYVDVNAILASLHYTAAGSAGQDTIRFDVWNQAGVETTATTALTIDPPASAAAAGFAAPVTGRADNMAAADPSGSAGFAAYEPASSVHYLPGWLTHVAGG